MTAAMWSPNGGRLNSYRAVIGNHAWVLDLRLIGWMMTAPMVGDVFVAPITADADVAFTRATREARRTA